LRERFQKNFLRGLFDLLAAAEKLAGRAEDARAVAADYLGEGGLVAAAREAREFRVVRLFKLLRQSRTPFACRACGGLGSRVAESAAARLKVTAAAGRAAP
jgi:hypothetical protein